MRIYTDTNTLFNDIRLGSTEAFEFVFKSYYPRLANYARKFIAAEGEVDDVVQECFIKLWERKEQLSTVSVSALLFTMVRNACLNHLRNNKLRGGIEQLELPKEASERLYSLDFLGDASSPLLYEELQRQINETMEQMPERQREVFRMSRFEGLKNREIAEQLGISIKVVEKHISKALATMREQFENIDNHEIYALLIAWMTFIE